MKYIFTITSLLYFSIAYSQWRKVQQLPSTDIFTIFHKDSTIYAGASKIIYISNNNGRTWDSTSKIPQLAIINNIIVFENELYAASPSSGVFKSSNGGSTWQNISAGIFPHVSDFSIYKGDLYASTLGNSVYKLNPANRNSWIFFSSGLSDLSANINSIAGNSNALIAGTNANGLYGLLSGNSTNWDERFLLDQISPNEGTYDIVTSGDTLFLAGGTGRFYMSTDNGMSWNLFGNILRSAFTSVVNAKQALVICRYIFDGATSNSLFHYIKKDSLQGSFTLFSIQRNHFTYKIDIVGENLWDASNNGLFFMSLSDLPGISNADDSIQPDILPVRFISANATCEGKKVNINWKTAEPVAINDFIVQSSVDGIHWAGIIEESQILVRNTGSYSTTDIDPVPNGIYRIAAYDRNNKVQYSSQFYSACEIQQTFMISPNPVLDKLSVRMKADENTQAHIKLFDGNGGLIRQETVQLTQGNNTHTINMLQTAKGVYYLSVEYGNGEFKRTSRVVKQ